MGHVLRGYLYGSSSEAPGMREAGLSLQAAKALPADARERQHVAALEALAAGAGLSVPLEASCSARP